MIIIFLFLFFWLIMIGIWFEVVILLGFCVGGDLYVGDGLGVVYVFFVIFGIMRIRSYV